jgi:hypothetical protein
LLKVNEEVARKYVKKKDGDMPGGLLAGFEAGEKTTDKEELQKMVEHIQGTIGAETVRLKKMKADHQSSVQADQAQQLELESELADMNAGNPRISNKTLSEQANNYVKETQVEIQNMLHGGGQGDNSNV